MPVLLDVGRDSLVKARTNYEPGREMLGGFSGGDGTIAFYNRVNSLLNPAITVLDIGAGRGSWFYLDSCDYRKKLRTIKGKVKEYICADVDEVVLTNPTSDRNVVMRDNRVPLDDNSIDIIITDFVLEHIIDVAAFKSEVYRLLKPGGYLCSRTPHRAHYISICARLIRNSRHAKLLSLVQPRRHREDVFPTAYKVNRLRDVATVFAGWDNFSYIFSPDPAYFFGSRLVYNLLSFVHAVVPKAWTGNIFVLLRKRS
jgi:SAM-dependent methyltransferase